MQFQNKSKITYMAFLTALALIFSYVEAILPIDFGIPGVKLGLANIVTVITLYLFGFSYALLVSIVRILLAGILFGNLFSIIYSVAGGVLSLLFMLLLYKTKKFSVLGVSMGGGVTHNLGQLLVAMLIVRQLKLYFYGPILIMSGLVMGALIGMLCMLIIKRVETYVRL